MKFCCFLLVYLKFACVPSLLIEESLLCNYSLCMRAHKHACLIWRLVPHACGSDFGKFEVLLMSALVLSAVTKLS